MAQGRLNMLSRSDTARHRLARKRESNHGAPATAARRYAIAAASGARVRGSRTAQRRRKVA